LICIFICTPICTKFYSCKKWVLQPGGEHCLVRTHFTMCYSMGRYQRGQNLQSITMPQDASLPLTNITDHHRTKTRRRLTGKPCLLGRRLCIVGWCRGEASPSTSSLHEGRCHRQVKTSLSNLPRNRPEHRPPHYCGGPGEQ
jgi:hypothetical protein